MESCGNETGQRVWAEGGQLEKTEQALFLQIPSSIIPLAEKGMFLSSGMGTGGTSQLRVLWPDSGEGQRPSCSCHFSNFFSLKCLICQCFIVWGRVSWNLWASQMVLVVKNPPANAGDTGGTGSISGLGRSPGGGNLMNRKAWWATVQMVTKSWT